MPQLLLDSVTDPQVRRLRAGAGSIEQWADNVDVLTSGCRRALVQALFGRERFSR